ncbi:MAG: glycosyltransferase family 8 protein [Candidatus Saccharibacteria bacterium]|nr:glycosyltransferase family 8 protein [Candidatus Saccharibacteria bacterium]
MSIFQTGKPLNKFTKIVPIFFTINSSYASYAATSIKSLTEKTDPKRYYRIIILHDGINLINRFRLRRLVTKNCAIQFKKITRSVYLRVIIRSCARRKGAGDFFSSAVYYYRAFIPRLFPQYEKAVYIDSDTILRGDIGELFDLDLKDKAMAAMVDPKVETIPEFRDYVNNAVGVPYNEYVNSGVLVMNLKKLRKMGYLKTMIELVERTDENLVAPDQDYLNVILRGNIKFLNPIWNAEPQEKLPRGTKLVHFNLCNKPWHYKNVPGEKLFWDAAKKTSFYKDLKRQQANFTTKEQKKEADKIAALIKKAAKLAKTKKPLIEL